MSACSSWTLPRLCSRTGKWKRQWLTHDEAVSSLTVQKKSSSSNCVICLWLVSSDCAPTQTFAQHKNLRGMRLWSKRGKIMWLQLWRRKKKPFSSTLCFFVVVFFFLKKKKEKKTKVRNSFLCETENNAPTHTNTHISSMQPELDCFNWMY